MSRPRAEFALALAVTLAFAAAPAVGPARCFAQAAHGEPQSPRSGDAGPAGAIAAALLQHGFESVSVVSRGDTVTVWFENRIYRYEMAALGVVALLAAPEADSAGVLELVSVTRGVPNAALSARAGDWTAFLRGDASAEWFRERLVVRPGPRAERAPEGKPRRDSANPSRWKLDLAARPLLEFQFGAKEDPFELGFWIAPEATLSPFRGGLVTAQAKIRVTDEFDPNSPAVTPGRTTISAARWIGGAWLAAASAGLFSEERYGFAAETAHLIGDGSFEVRAGGDLSGFIRFEEDSTSYSDLEQWSAFTAVTYRLRGIDLETTVLGGRFYEGDAGARVDVLRRWGEVDFSLYGIKTEDGSVAGFRLTIPLPVERLGAPARVRLATVPNFPIEYRESVEPVGRQVRLFDNTARFRKGLFPTVVHNNVADLRQGRRFLEGEGG